MELKKVRLLYLIYNENLLHSGILRGQVIKLLEQLSTRRDVESICLLSFVNPRSMINSREAWHSLSTELGSKGIQLKLSPMFFPIRWNFIAILIAAAHCLPVLLFTMYVKHCNVVHTRSYIAGFFGHILKNITGIVHIFDPRGPMPEEMSQNNYWRKGTATYKFWKSIEARMIAQSSAVIAVTPGYNQQFKQRNARKSVFIPNRGDVGYFINESSTMPIPNRPQFLFIGEMVSYWNRPELVAGRFLQLKSVVADLHLRIITRMDHDYVRDKFSDLEIDDNDWSIESALPKEIPSKISGCSLGYLVATVHKEGVWPVKMAEYLACGIPLAVEEGAGDHMSNLVEKHRLGIVFRDNESYPKKAAEIIENLPEYSNRCREFAKKHLDMSRSADQYLRLYKQELN